MDPLILQQFHALVQQRAPEASLEVAALVRSYLEMPELLPPTKNQPHPDPIRFQRLDHTFVRTQWLHTVNSCRSKLFAGFPSDHYPLITEVQVKLAAKNIKKPKPRKFDFTNVTQEQREQFNQRVRKYLGQRPEEPSDPPTSSDTPPNALSTQMALEREAVAQPLPQQDGGGARSVQEKMGSWSGSMLAARLSQTQTTPHS